MHYVTVFDAATRPHPLESLQLGAIATLGCILVAIFPQLLGKTRFREPRLRLLVRCAFFAVFLIFADQTASSYFDIVAARADAQAGKCSIIEGRVESYRGTPGGHREESFSVRGIPFRYSNREITGGFNTTAQVGGPIREGLPVRICYRGGEILRLDVAH